MFSNETKYFDVLESTNLTAKKYAEEGVEEGTIIRAGKQTKGRGRLGRAWKSSAGAGLWFSLILRPCIDPQFASQVTLLAAVAVVETLKLTTNITCKIKWPNDIWVKDKKICGILSEMQLSPEGIDYVIVGIGINVKISIEDLGKELSEIATSVSLETGKDFDCDIILNKFRDVFLKWYKLWQAESFYPIRKQWLEDNCTLGKYVEVKDDDKVIFEGYVKGINEYGSIVVQSSDEIIKEFDFGEISIRFNKDFA